MMRMRLNNDVDDVGSNNNIDDEDNHDDND
jgi:hypothetical protein